MIKAILILIFVVLYIMALTQDAATLLVMTALCFILYFLVKGLAASIPPDDTNDFRGYRKRPYTKEELDFLHRASLGKSRKEKRRIAENFTHF